jgi:serine/threonine protein kinase
MSQDGVLPEPPVEINIPDVKLEKYVGGGAQGLVYSGRVCSTGFLVAVKILRGDYVKTGGTAAQEALLLARLRHRNIMRVFRFQPQDTFWVVIMELVQGSELARCRLTLDEARRCFIHLADALCTLAEARIVHRDIKPRNIVLRHEDHCPVLVDFGLAIDLANPLHQLKPAEWIAGTPLFMAPEVFSGAQPDPAWDAYSLGVTAIRALSKDGLPGYHRGTELLQAKMTGTFDHKLLQSIAVLEDVAFRHWCTDLIGADRSRRMAAVQSAHSTLIEMK